MTKKLNSLELRREERQEIEQFVAYTRQLRKDIRADKSVGLRFLQKVGVLNKNGQMIGKP